MNYGASHFRRAIALFVFLAGLPLLPSTALAVVGDVTLTGLPLNATVSLINDETKEKVEQKTDDRGFVMIPMTGKSWQSGRHSVICQIDGKPVSSKIFLRDGANRVDLTALTLSARPLDPAKRQRVDEALQKSSATLKADPKNAQALLTQGSALNRLGRHGQALSSLTQAATLGSTHPALAFETGWSLMRLGMYPQAIAQLEKYEKLKPGLGQTSEFIGRSHLYMGELDKADAKFNEALKREPNLAPTVRFHQAILETLRKNPQAASNHITALMKEAPDSPTAQIFKNATLQAKETKSSAIPGANDYNLSDPIRIQLPATTTGDVAGAVARGVVGGVMGGMMGGVMGGLLGGGAPEPEKPKLVAKPKYPETTLTSKDGKSKIDLSGAIEKRNPRIVMGVRESPGKGAPHLILLQDKNCNVLRPKETSVFQIWESWGAFRMGGNWTKTYYQDGQVVGQEKGSWETPWHVFRTEVKDPSEIPAIWKDFAGKPFGEIRGVISSFEAPSGVPFNPADWDLITHATTDAGNNQIVTVPIVTGLAADPKNNLAFKQKDLTACESAPPSAPLVASPTAPPGVILPPSGAPLVSSHTAPVQLPPGVMLPPSGAPLVTGPTTFPWTVGPYGVTVSQAPGLVASPTIVGPHALTVSQPWLYPGVTMTPAGVGPPLPASPEKPKTATPSKGPTVEPSPDGAKVENRPDVADYAHTPRTMTESRPPEGVKSETRPDGTKVETRPDGITIETRPDGTIIDTHPDGLKIEKDRYGIETVTRPDGTRITTFPGGTRIVTRPDGHWIRTDPDGTRAELQPDGTWIVFSPDGRKFERRRDGTVSGTGADGTTMTSFPDGTRTETRPDGTRNIFLPNGARVEVRKDGTAILYDPPQARQPTQPPPQPADTPAPPNIFDFIDEKIVIS